MLDLIDIIIIMFASYDPMALFRDIDMIRHISKNSDGKVYLSYLGIHAIDISTTRNVKIDCNNNYW